ncbi:MAG: SMP-30/gluconolactonase/LRE family protein, partial [Chitinophagaceae bacterium]
AGGAKLQQVCKGFAFTEGPAVDKKGNIFFTDQPNNRIWKYSTDGKLSIFLEPAGRSNGLAIDKAGNIISCADENGQLWSIDKNAKATVLIKDYQGQKMNGPNDLWIHSSGNIYITDPYYQREYWERKKPDMKTQDVYLLAKGKKQLQLVADSLAQPNGITGSPDGKFLYVADIRAGKTYRYNINKDGSLSSKMLFVSQGSDGMTVDQKGNLYLSGNGVTIYDLEGKKREHIDIPSKWTGNLCFGGKDRSLLFITASESVFTMKMKVQGAEEGMR